MSATNRNAAVPGPARAATNTAASVPHVALPAGQTESLNSALTSNDLQSALQVLHSTLESYPPASPLSAPRPPSSTADSSSPQPVTRTAFAATNAVFPLTNPPPTTNAVVNAAGPSGAGMESLDDKRKLSSGDRFSFRIVEDQEEPRALVVTDSGDVEVPYIGRVPALDKTCRQLALEIKARLEVDYYYQATVIIAVDQFSRNQGKVYLVGYVLTPGPQEIPGDEVFTLSKAIMRAGGFGQFADKKRVKVTRKAGTAEATNQTFEVNVGAILEAGKTENDLKLEPGDLIYVPSRLFKF